MGVNKKLQVTLVVTAAIAAAAVAAANPKRDLTGDSVQNRPAPTFLQSAFPHPAP